MSHARQRPESSRTLVAYVDIHVQPRAKRTEIVGWHGDAVKVRLAAPPADGAANEALIAYLAAELGIARSTVEIVAGQTSRHKRLAVAGMTREAVLGRLGLQ